MVATDVQAVVVRELKVDSRRLQKAREALAELMGNPGALANHRQQLAKLLGELRDQLAIHFALEEACGYFDEARDVAPHLERRAAVLQNEHPALFERVRRLAEEAEQRLMAKPRTRRRSPPPAASPSDVSWFTRFARRYQTFDRKLTTHEERENELMIDAFETDMGVGD